MDRDRNTSSLCPHHYHLFAIFPRFIQDCPKAFISISEPFLFAGRSKVSSHFCGLEHSTCLAGDCHPRVFSPRPPLGVSKTQGYPTSRHRRTLSRPPSPPRGQHVTQSCLTNWVRHGAGHTRILVKVGISLVRFCVSRHDPLGTPSPGSPPTHQPQSSSSKFPRVWMHADGASATHPGVLLHSTRSQACAAVLLNRL